MSKERLTNEKGYYVVWTANCIYEGSWCAGLRYCKLKKEECEYYGSKKKDSTI